MRLTGKNIIILGAGRSGRAAALLALREGARVAVWDMAGPEAFKDMPADVEIHPNATADDGAQAACDILIVSPGIDTYGPYVAAFSQQAGEVIGEVELAYRSYHGKIIGITGTNGKTTTTELVARILAQAGFALHIGNRPGLAVVDGLKWRRCVHLALFLLQILVWPTIEGLWTVGQA